jgi:hypothetical protein
VWFRRKTATTPAISLIDLAATRFGNLADIEQADCEKYSSCRGPIPRSKLIHDACAACAGTDQELEVSDDLSELVYGTFLWDELCHQGTLYSLTPIGAYYICKKVKEIGLRSRFLYSFLAHLQKTGTGGIYLSPSEVLLNKAGMLPIFRLEDVFDRQVLSIMSSYAAELSSKPPTGET